MKKIICALLAATFLSAGVISGCSSGEAQPPAQSSDSSSSQSSAESSKEESSKEESSNQGVDVAVTSLMKPKAELLASLSADNLSNIGGFIGINQGFFYYTGSSRYDENAKYGVLNSDTNKIENAEYSYMQEASYQDSNNHKLGYYSCTKAKSTKTISDMNSFGLVSTSGKELVPLKYASIQVLNDKYAKVVTVESETSDKSNALLYKNPDDKAFSIGMSSNATLYKGKWQIYDLEKKALVPGVEGKTAEDISAKGSIIKVGKDKYYGSTGDQIEKIAKLLDNGAYTVETGAITHVNDTDGKKLFQIDNKSVYISQAYDDNTFLERVNSAYYFVDSSGNKISGDFDKVVSKEGSMYTMYVDSGYELYDINAKKVYDGDIKYCSYNKQFDIYKITDHDGVITYLDKDAKVIAALPDDSNLITDETNGVAYVKGQSNPYSVYCFADKKPSITSKDSPKDCAPFSFDNGSGVISALDNSTLIDENYTSIISNGNGLVIAKKTDGSADFYKITIA